MRIPLLWLALLATVPPPPLTGQTPWFGSSGSRWGDYRGARYPVARLWLERERDYYRRGERLDVRFSVAEDAYVAVIHIDTDGDLDFLYPRSPWDEGYVRGGRSYTLPGVSAAGWLVRGRPGIGYFYLVASPEPLDYRNFSGRRGGGWDWSYAGRSVRGDPFWAMEQISRFLVADPYVPYATDYYSYYVDGRYRYPSYACADRYGASGRGWGWSSAYGPCDRLDYFLREHPYYYDARLYRGDRRDYFRERYGDREPRHGYKEPLDRRSRGVERSAQPAPAPPSVTPRRRDPEPRDARPERRDAPEPRRTPERRPALERRGGERSGATGTPASPRPAPRASDAGRDRAPSTGRAAPRARPAPRDTLPSKR